MRDDNENKIMKWEFVKPLESDKLIEEYEAQIGYVFPEDFNECVKQYNGAYPEREIFRSKNGKRVRKRVFNNLCSFKKEDPLNIWKYNNWNGWMRDWNQNGEMEKYIAFAKDPFGNLICFDKTNDMIVFVDHETLNIEFVANSFTELIESLRRN